MTGKWTGVLKRRCSEWLAILAVFVLLAHSMVAGFVDGAMAQPQLVDYFGNPICSAHDADQSTDPSGPAGGHAHLPDCCLAGCSLVGGHALPGAAQPFLIAPLAEQVHSPAPGYGVVRATFERSPLNPRAPPTSV